MSTASRTSSQTRQLAYNAVFAAMVAVLGYFSLNFGNFKITFESLPILLSGLLMGPLAGVAVGGIGTFIYQMLRFGLMPTTPMWMAPYVVAGFVVGWYAKQKGMTGFSGAPLSTRNVVFIVVIAQLLITSINTVCLYIDSHIYGYYTPTLIAGMLVPRFILAVVMGVAFGVLIPQLINALRRSGH